LSAGAKGGEAAGEGVPVHRRRPRYPGKNPRRFEHKYKEHRAAEFPEEARHVESRGKTVAGTHRPIMVREVLGVLAPRPGETGVDATLGHGGHALEMLGALMAGGAPGRLLGLDVDPVERPRAEARIRAAGYTEGQFVSVASNHAGLPGVLERLGWGGADVVLADLGVSSMQIDDPARGFSVKFDGPLDLRMNPARGVSAADWLAGASERRIEEALREGADEARAGELARALAGARAGRGFRRTLELAGWLREWAGPHAGRDAAESLVRRVFQALRIAVNDEYSSLGTFLRLLPTVLRPGGRVAVLTFHSGEDRRVKHAFREGVASGVYVEAPEEVTRPSAEERRANPRSAPAKLRWARRA
jgi:16S rRNA (cytosine1402-N4)-methyltransferase